MSVYDDSYAVIWHGPRRSGKSGSMAVECLLNLLAGKRVFADSPVSFNFDLEDGSGLLHYATEPLVFEEFFYLLESEELKKKYYRSVIAWDEIDKRLSSRRWQSAFNKICGEFITYIGKLEMTFLMTAQKIRRVDNQIRDQVDAEISCVDLSFEYPSLERGSFVGQLARDVSGRYTGHMYDDSLREYQQTLRLKEFWPIWDTKHAESILDAWQGYEIRQNKKVINIGGGVEGLFGDSEDARQQKNQNRLIVYHLVEEMRDSGTTFTRQEVVRMARERGYRASDEKLLRNLGEEGVAAIRKGELAVVG